MPPVGFVIMNNTAQCTRGRLCFLSLNVLSAYMSSLWPLIGVFSNYATEVKKDD